MPINFLYKARANQVHQIADPEVYVLSPVILEDSVLINLIYKVRAGTLCSPPLYPVSPESFHLLIHTLFDHSELAFTVTPRPQPNSTTRCDTLSLVYPVTRLLNDTRRENAESAGSS